MAVVQTIYDVPPHLPEEHHCVIDNFNTIVTGMQMHGYDLEVLAQTNAVLTSSNSMALELLSQMSVAMNNMQAQLNTLSLMTTNPKRTKRKFYCWSCGRNFTHGGETCTTNKTGHR